MSVQSVSVKKRLFKRLDEWQTVFSPKLKIVWSMLQMLALLGICFGVQWPAQYEEVVRAVEEGVNLNFIKLVTVSCWQEWTWHHTLLLRTLAPSALKDARPTAKKGSGEGGDGGDMGCVGGGDDDGFGDDYGDGDGMMMDDDFMGVVKVAR